jgi:hypothetical protein
MSVPERDKGLLSGEKVTSWRVRRHILWLAFLGQGHPTLRFQQSYNSLQLDIEAIEASMITMVNLSS